MLPQPGPSCRSEYGKPVLVTEYGGDTVAGLHTLPSLMFTEEWQAEMLRAYWAVFDTLRPEPWLVERGSRDRGAQL